MRTSDPHHIARPARACPTLIAAMLLVITACDAIRDRAGDTAKQDTSTLPPSGAGAMPPRAGEVVGETTGVPAVPQPPDTSAASRDTGVVAIVPQSPALGDLLFALAQGIAAREPRCSWKGRPIPCHREETGVLALVPLPPTEPAGTYTLVFERAGGRVVREIEVANREFPRELVFVTDSLYQLLRRRDDIARDARVLARALSTASPERQWRGNWRSPVAGTASGFGEERFYYPVADSGRSIRLDPELRTTGYFGIDTVASGRTAAPGWRWGGVDYDVRARTFVVAPAAATVAEVGEYTLTGRTVLLDHGRGVFSAYYHLDTVLVRRGDEVSAGRQIGRVGSTGLTSRPRLHHAVFVHGEPVDPRRLRELPPFAR